MLLAAYSGGAVSEQPVVYHVAASTDGFAAAADDYRLTR